MNEILLVRDPKEIQALGQVARRIFLLLNLGVSEERESSNHVDGHYFFWSR